MVITINNSRRLNNESVRVSMEETFEEMCEKIWERYPDTIIYDKQRKEHRHE